MVPSLVLVCVLVYSGSGYTLCKEELAGEAPGHKVIPCSIRSSFHPSFQGGFWLSGKLPQRTQELTEDDGTRKLMNIIFKVIRYCSKYKSFMSKTTFVEFCLFGVVLWRAELGFGLSLAKRC